MYCYCTHCNNLWYIQKYTSFTYFKLDLHSVLNKLSVEVASEPSGMGVGMGKMGEGGPKVHTSRYEVQKSWGCKVQRGDSSQQDCIVHLKVAKSVRLNVPTQEKNCNCVW